MKYTKDKIKECVEWVEVNGLIDRGGAMQKDFCKAMDINHQTYYEWMQKAEFAEAIKKAKEVFASTLEKRLVTSMVKAATGYEIEETETEYVNAKDGKPMIKKQVIKKKQVAPNVGAGIFLLTNINPEEWKNRQNNDITSGGDKINLNVEVRSNEIKDAVESLKNAND